MPNTVKELLADWKIRRAGMVRIISRTDDVETVKTATAMYYQLGVCIDELEKVLAGSWLANAISKNILNANKVLTKEQWDELLPDKEK